MWGCPSHHGRTDQSALVGPTQCPPYRSCRLYRQAPSGGGQGMPPALAERHDEPRTTAHAVVTITNPSTRLTNGYSVHNVKVRFDADVRHNADVSPCPTAPSWQGLSKALRGDIAQSMVRIETSRKVLTGMLGRLKPDWLSGFPLSYSRSIAAYPLGATSSTYNPTTLQARSLLSIARLNIARRAFAPPTEASF